MSKYSGVNFDVFLVDGYNLAAAMTEAVTISVEDLTQQTNPFGVTSEEHTPITISKGTLTSAGGFYDPTTDALHTAIATVVGIARVVCAAIVGNVAGKPFVGFEGAYTHKYDVMDFRDGLTKANVTYIVSGKVEEGQIVQDLATFTADWDTKTGGAGAADAPVDYTLYDGNRPHPITSNSLANPSVVTTPTAHGLTTGDIVFIAGVITSSPTINGERVVTVISPTTFSVPVNVATAGTGGTFVRSNTSGGGAGYLQVSAFSGFSGVVMKIMDSPDDLTYAALVTFTTVAGITKERIEVSGNVDRYLASNGDVTGSGSITVFSGFSRF